MEGQLDAAAELAAEQEKEIIRLQEEIEWLSDELEARGDPEEDDDC